VQAPGRDRLSLIERLGAWLGLWTPPRGVEVPPAPWRAIGVGAAVVAALLGTAAAIAIPRIEDRREADRQREEASEARRHEAFLAHVRREQAPRHGSGEADPGATDARARRLQARRSLLASAATAIAGDARRGTDKDVERAAECEPFPRSLSGLDPAAELDRPAATYDCVAVTARFGRADQPGGRGIIGTQYRLVVHFRRGRFAWCRVIPLGDRDRLSNPLPDACRLPSTGQK
jgi:hypothetical protein